MADLTPQAIVRAQDRLLVLLGNSPDGRAPLVASMLKRDSGEAMSYWFQLVVSVGIATLGLVVGSTAVVIGAMLVAPLMGPIVGLAMGLAVGSPFLVLRSAGRIWFSVVAAVAGAGLITLLLPFHELNAEIAARTSPTVLDLITAGFCALAGVYASLRHSSDTATTAAGTSISISLVPPLCASGYGFGTGAWSVAGGAALLFLTNLVAIVVVGTMAFVAAGFKRVDVTVLEREELTKEETDSSIARALARRLAQLFESRWGPAMRFLMPFLLLAAVYVPLRSALDEVAWQVRVRAAVREIISREPLRVVQSRVRVERREVELVVVVLGKAHDAELSRARLDAEIRQASGVTPRVDVLAVPDANAVAGLESSLLARRKVDVPVVAPAPSAEHQLNAVRERVRSAVTDVWPSSAVGAPLSIDIGAASEGPLGIQIVHRGVGLSGDTLEVLRRTVSASLRRDVSIVDVAVPAQRLTRQSGDLAFVAQVSTGVRATVGVQKVSVCVVRKGEPPGPRTPVETDVQLSAALDSVLAAHPRVTMATGDDWSVQFVEGLCPVSTPPDGGSADAALPR